MQKDSTQAKIWSKVVGGYFFLTQPVFTRTVISDSSRQCVHTSELLESMKFWSYNKMRVFSGPYTRNRTGRHYSSHRMCVE